MRNSIKARTKRTLNQAHDRLLTQVRRLKDDRICIGVTGLSGSGKSSFITSLINQLQNYSNAKLSSFSPWLQHRILAVKQHPIEDRYLANFDYQKAINGLVTTPPQWPSSTQDVSGVLLEIKLRSKAFTGRNTTRSLFVEIRDYPGEWLLDLPLLKQSYAQWSQQMEQLLATEPRRSMLNNPQLLFAAVDPSLTADNQVIDGYAQVYKQFLHASRNREYPLSQIQPGRYLLPGQAQNIPALFPLLSLANWDESSLNACGPESYFRVLERRFELYKRDIVRPFFKHFIRPIDRQIILIDAIAAVSSDENYLKEVLGSIEQISECFNYGSGSIFSTGVDKVLFGATKVDQVIARDHDQVRHLLASMVRSSLERISWQNADYRVEAIAAIRSGNETTIEGDECIVGFSQKGEAIGYVHPRIPAHIPSKQEWETLQAWHPETLNPPVGIHPDHALPHIRMDRVLQELIGDKCR